MLKTTPLRVVASLLVLASLASAAALGTPTLAAPSDGIAGARGMYVGFNTTSRHAAAERDLGGEILWSVVMADHRSTSAMKSSVWAQFTAPDAYLPRVAHRANVTVTVPLAFGSTTAKTPAGRAKVGADLAATAAGANDDHYIVVARRLIEAGYGDAIIRLGHEADGDYYPWSAPDNEQRYIDAFRHVHDVFARESSSFRFEWTTMRPTFASRGPVIYPGDAYVDIVGMDIYYRSNAALTDDVWRRQYEAPLRAHQEFAAAHGKPVAYSEWGVAFHDQPRYIELMHGWFSSLPTSGPGRLLYQSYFNAPVKGYDLAHNPQSRATYLRLFGGAAGAPHAPPPPSTGPVTPLPPTPAPEPTTTLFPASRIPAPVSTPLPPDPQDETSDERLPTIHLEAGRSKREGQSLPFRLRLSAPTTRDVSVVVGTGGGTATAGVDYHPRLVTVVIPAGETATWVGVATIRDQIREKTETVQMSINSVTHATVATPTAAGVIVG